MLLIVSPNYKGEVQLLAETAKILGWDIYHDGWRIPEHLLHSPGAVYGEQFFCEVVAEQMNWKLVANPFDWLAKLPETYTARKVSFMKLSEARNITEEKFIKPADDKCFPAKVYSSGKELTTNKDLDDVPILVSHVMKFTSEYRCVVKDRKVITSCCYLYKDYRVAEPEINKPINYNVNYDAVVDFVNTMLADVAVECVESTVIDVGRFKKDTYAVIESNPVYASGIYGCEFVAMLDAIKAACINEGK
jgi:hypothetical protein